MARRFNGTVRLDLPETPVARAQREAIERAAEDTALRGRPLPRRARLERTTLERYLRASGGPLAYMRRLRLIESERRAHEQALGKLWSDLAGSGERFATTWRGIAVSWDFSAVNALIAEHNRWYPVEAQLPMDPRTGDYALVRGRPYRQRPLDAAWVLERFPAVRSAAVQSL